MHYHGNICIISWPDVDADGPTARLEVAGPFDTMDEADQWAADREADLANGDERWLNATFILMPVACPDAMARPLDALPVHEVARRRSFGTPV